MRRAAMRAASLLALVNAPLSAALNNGFTKPEMGFNTWESWGCDISEQKVHAAADALADPIVLVRTQEVQVAREHLFADPDHLLLAEARIDMQRLQRLVEPGHVLLQLERPAVEASGHVEDGIAILEAAVAEGDQDLSFRNIAAVEIGDALVGLLGHDGVPLSIHSPSCREFGAHGMADA